MRPYLPVMVALSILGFLVLAVSFFLPKPAPNVPRFGPLLAIGGIVLIGIGVIGETFITIPAGFRGVLLQFNAVHGVLDEGPHFITPYIQSVELIEVRTQKEAADANAASKDLQMVQAKVAVNFHIDPGRAGDLYRKVGRDFAARIIDPATQETVKAVVANYTAEELINRRGEVKAQIDAALGSRLGAYDIIVESGGVSLTNFEFSSEFNHAIEQKQVAQQTAEQQKYVLEKAKLEADTAIATAKGRAEAAQLEAAAFNAQGGAKVLAKAWIEKWDGRLPAVAGNNSNIIDLRSLMNGADAGTATPRP
jgi:regulator of protease activity HflC (stomatin/prohibitin superfamily)